MNLQRLDQQIGGESLPYEAGDCHILIVKLSGKIAALEAHIGAIHCMAHRVSPETIRWECEQAVPKLKRIEQPQQEQTDDI